MCISNDGSAYLTINIYCYIAILLCSNNLSISIILITHIYFKGIKMSDIKNSLSELMSIDGAVGTSIVDYKSGMSLGHEGSGVDLELAAAGNSQVVKAKMETMKSLGIKGEIEDILITLESQLHIIRPSANNDGLFIYLVLDKNKSNLALARRKVQTIENALEI